MKPQSKCILIISFLLSSWASYAQTLQAADKLKDAANNYQRRFPQEKLFVHTNQNAYTAGQTVWYKIYTMAYGKPSELSNIVYLNLTDPGGKSLIQNKRPLTKGSTSGDFLLPDTLHTGWYNLQAYTAWMLNFKEDAICQQRIYIKNLHDPVSAETSNITAVKYHVSFYPEGGDLINGNNSNIVFKAKDEYGQPAAISGEVLVNNKNTGVKLVTVHDGMGSFKVDTYTADKYTVNVRYPDNTTETYTLPSVKMQGTSLSVNLIPDFISLNMFYSGPSKSEDVVITAMQSNGISSAYPLKLNRGNNLVRFKKSDFSTGIMRFTVFDQAYIPLSERIAFINNNNNRFDFNLITDTLSFQNRTKNTFSIKLTRQKKASVSIAVIDADNDTAPNENIVSDFLLTSEIKGYVNNPSYYFTSNSDTLQQQLDLVMLTNGWRHFKWTEILNKEPATLRYAPEKTQFVAGKIENYDTKKDYKVKFIIVDPKANKHFENVLPDSSGQFAIDDNKLSGIAELYYNVVDGSNRKQPAKLKFTNSIIDSLPFITDSVSYDRNSQQVYSASLLDTLKHEQQLIDFDKDIVLNEVRIKAMRKGPVEEVIKNHVKTITPDRVFDLDLVNTPSLPSISLIQYIQGRFPGLEIHTGPNDKVVFVYRGVSTIMEGNETDNAINPPVFYLNEIMVEYEDVRDISIYDLALVRYAPPPAWFAPLGGGLTGAMLLYTKNYKDDNMGGVDTKNFDLYNLKGYSVSREFSEPDYTDPALLKKHDYRSTLYWNANVTPDGNNTIKIHFFNSDKAKRYRITMQGIDAEGRMGYFSKLIQ